MNNRHALITGAGGGIGAAIALLLAQVGCRLALCVRSQGTLQAQAEDMRVSPRCRPRRKGTEMRYPVLGMSCRSQPAGDQVGCCAARHRLQASSYNSRRVHE